MTFLPEFSVVTPGVVSRPLIKPEVIREISLVSIEGRSWSPAVETFTRAVQTYPWHHARLQKGASRPAFFVILPFGAKGKIVINAGNETLT